MAYSREQLMTALRNADAAGDNEGATRIAQIIKSQGIQTQHQPEQSLMQTAGDFLTGGQSAGQIVEQAARGIANVPFDVLQGGASLINAASQGLGGPKILDDVYRPVDRPTDPYAQAGETVGGYLVPFGAAAKAAGVAEKAPGVINAASNAGNMVVGSLAEAGNQHGDFAENTAKNAAINLGAQGVLSGLGRLLSPGGDQVLGSGIIGSANDVAALAKTGEGRRIISDRAANISDEVAKAADIAGIDVNALTPGMRSGNRGISQSEGILASKPGITQDAHTKAFGEIQSKFNTALDDLGAEAGSASEKSRAIKQRVLSGIDSMKASESSAWDSVRSTMPDAKSRMSNTNATIRADIDAGMPATSEMKQFITSYNKAGKNGITFDAMKAWRGKLADAENKYTRSGEASTARRMGELRDAATEDMRAMAQNGGFLDQWTTANDLSKARFAAQKQAEAALGKDLATDKLVFNGVKALENSAKTGTSQFHQMIGALPESERSVAISSILQDAVSQGMRGGKSDAAGVSHIASILTPQNIAAISKHSPEIGKIAGAYGELARAATRPLRYVEKTGVLVPVQEALEKGLPNVVNTVLKSIQNSGAIAGGFGGGVLGSISGALAGGAVRGVVEKIGATRSGRYAIEKAIQEATKGVRAGGSANAMAAAERRFMANKGAVKAIRDAVGNDDFQRLTRAGIVASLSGMAQE